MLCALKLVMHRLFIGRKNASVSEAAAVIACNNSILSSFFMVTVSLPEKGLLTVFWFLATSSYGM